MSESLEHTFILEQPIQPGSSLHCVVDDRHPDGCIGFAEVSSWYTKLYDRNLKLIHFEEKGIESTIGPVEILLGAWALVRVGVGLLANAAVRTAATGMSVGLGLRIAVTLGPAIERLRAAWVALAGGGAAMLSGPTGQVAHRTLDRLMAVNNGPVITLVTNLTQRPQIGRALSTAIGPGGSTLAAAARTNGQTFVARVPAQLVAELERVGLATRSITSMGSAVGTEIRFEAAASRWIVPFFH